MNVISFQSRAKTIGMSDDLKIKSESYSSAEHLIELVASVQSKEAFKKLFIEFAPKIKSFMLGQGANSTEAEEIAQETMIKVWQKADSFQASKARASTWIFVIARNLRIDNLRKTNRAKVHMGKHFFDDVYEENIPQKMDLEKSSRLLLQNLKELPNEQLQVIKLSFYENLSHSEIASLLNLPIGTVKSRLRLALNRLRNKNIEGEF